jgi:glycosyltransferase involved in cell wall biosynthesis
MKFVFFANTDWYLYNFRLATAQRLQSAGDEVVMVSPPGEFGARFAEAGFRWRTLKMERASLNPLREAATLRELVLLLREERPDLLHNFTVKCAVYGGIAARAAKVPATVNAVAGMGYVFSSDKIKARVLRPVVRTLMRGALGGGGSRLILQNPDDAQAFASHRLVPERHIRLIRSSGVDTKRFSPGPSRPQSQRPLQVLLAARLLWEKGIGEFVEAAALLGGQGRNLKFLLAGQPDDGNPGSVRREQVEDWQRQGLITWLGHVEDMPTLLRSVDVMVLPSYYREGVPRSLIEGAASGLALITTDEPGCREVVSQHGIDGLHVKPRDAESLAAAIAALDDDRELLDRLGRHARGKALQEFDEGMVIDRTIEVYHELFDASGLRPRTPAGARAAA